MLYRLLRPLLFQLDPERAHALAMATAQAIARHGHLLSAIRQCLARPTASPRKVAGLTFDNPIGLAAGLDKNAQALPAWWAFGFGFAEVGTVTPQPQPGQPQPRLFRFPQKHALVNRMGFNNDGATIIAQRLETLAADGLRPPFPIGISIGKNATTPAEEAAQDYSAAAAALAPYADYLAINVSSPNTAGLRELQSPLELAKVLQAVRASASGRPLFVKIAPELTGRPLAQVLETCGEHSAAGIIATNTLDTQGRDGLPQGGLSGRPLRELALARVGEVRRLVGDKMAIIGCGGIDDAPSARAMLNAGADLIQIYTGLIYSGPFLPARLTRKLVV